MEIKPYAKLAYSEYSQNIDQGMLRSAQPNQFSTFRIQNIDILGLAVLIGLVKNKFGLDPISGKMYF